MNLYSYKELQTSLSNVGFQLDTELIGIEAIKLTLSQESKILLKCNKVSELFQYLHAEVGSRWMKLNDFPLTGK